MTAKIYQFKKPSPKAPPILQARLADRKKRIKKSLDRINELFQLLKAQSIDSADYPLDEKNYYNPSLDK